MTSKKAKERAKAFIKSIEGLSYDDCKAAIAKEIESLKLEYSITTVRTILTDYRKFDTLNKHLYTITDKEQSDIETKYKESIAVQANDQTQIQDFEGMIKTAIDLLSSSRVAEVATALSFLTGRRFAEIFCTAKFAKCATPEKVYFFGQLKKRDDAQGYAIYALCDIDQIQKAQKFINDNVGEISANLANTRYSKSCNQIAYKHFSKYLNDCSVHDLRKAYATIIAHLYRPQRQTLNAFLSENLGHAPTDLSTANVYQKYFI